jgi:hypothetical protein
MVKKEIHYTPTIEEFHVGFEYEIEETEQGSGHKYWRESIFGNLLINPHGGMFSTDMKTVKDWIKEECVRVKYLDQEDVESLGWKHIVTKSIGKDHYEGCFEKSTCGLMCFDHDWLNNKITIKHPNYIRDGSGRFDGYIYYANKLVIKNKSELKKLMQMLSII